MHIINLGILAHVDAGKTTLTEGLLYHGGVIRRMGRVDKGTTITDSMELEQKRGMTIRSSTVSFTWNDTKINLIDTPGHMDFAAEVERSLAVIDGVVLVISAREGVQPQTRVIFKKLREMELPVILFINKLDRAGACLEDVYRAIRSQLIPNILPMQKVEGEGTEDFTIEQYFPESDCIREELIGGSEELLSQYLEGRPITPEILEAEMKSRVARAQVVPVYHGSALDDRGVKELLDAVSRYFSDIPIMGNGSPNGQKDTNSGQEDQAFSKERSPGLSAYIYKLERDGRGHRCLFFRVYTGCLSFKDSVRNVRTGEAFTVSNLFAVRNGKRTPADRIGAGDIGVILDRPGLKCGDFLGSSDGGRKGCFLERPLLTAAAEYGNLEERRRLLAALTELEEEDPMLSLRIDPQTEEIKLRFFGLLQMEIVETLLKERFGVSATFGLPAAVRVERPAGEGSAGISIYESGNHLYAGMRLTIEPLPAGKGFSYVNQVSYGYLERPFQNAALEGIKKGLEEGLYGHEVIDCRVTFQEADYDSVMGTPADFRKLAPKVVKLALGDAGVQVLVPWEAYELKVPAGMEKMALSELIKRQGRMEGIEYQMEEAVISGIIPLETSGDLSIVLAGLSEGKAVFTSRFYEYLPEVPEAVND